MPRIPTTDPQVGLSIGNQPNMPMSFGTATGRAVQQLGSAISGLQGAFNAAEKEREKDDLFKTKLALGEFAGNQDRFQAEYDNGISDDGSGHADNRLKRFDTDAGKLYERIPQSESARQYAALQLQRLRNNYGNQSTDVEIRQRGRYTINQTTGFIQNQVLPKITGDVKSALTGLDMINGLVESSPIRDDVKEKIRDNAVKTVLEAWVAKAGPEAAARAETLAAAYGPGARDGATPGSVRAAQEADPNRETENVSRGTQEKSVGNMSAGEFLRTRLAKGYEKRTGDVDGLQPVMQDRLGGFLRAAEEAGHDIRIISGHRSQERQKVLWERALKKYGSEAEARKWVAPPGGSSHNAGLAVDLQYGDRGAGLGGKRTAAVQWAHENARRYGLHFRLGHEDWHIEPVEVTRGGNAAGRVKLHQTDFYERGGMGRRRDDGVSMIVQAEGRRDSQGRLQVYNLPSNDGGGKFEVAGINDRYHPQAARKLAGLIRSGRHQEAEEYATKYIREYTNQSARLVENPAAQYLVRDVAFNRGPGGANAVLRMAIGGAPRSKAEAHRALTASEKQQIARMDATDLIERVTRARAEYERQFVGVRPNLQKGLEARWQTARENALGMLDDRARSVANDNAPDLKERFARELIKQLPQIQRASDRAEREQQIAERRQQREIQTATAKEATKLLVGGELTEQWLADNEGNLSDSAYRRFLESIKPRVRVTNPKVLAELMERTDEDPDAVMSDALAARNAGELEDKDLRLIQRSIYGTAREAERPEWEKSLRRDLKLRLRPSRDDSPDEWAAYYKAMETFDDYVEKGGGKLDRKALTEFQTDLVKSTKENRIRAKRETLSMMRFSQVGRNALTLEEVSAAEVRMLQALQAKKLSPAEANQEWQLIKQWRKTLEDEYKALGKEPPKPQTVTPAQPAAKPQAATPAAPASSRFGFAPGANLDVDPAVAAEVKAYSDTLPDDVKMQLLDESGNPKPETMQLVSSAMKLGATPDKVPSILQTIYGIGNTSTPFYQQDGVNVSTADFNQAYQSESDWRSSPWGAVDQWAEGLIQRYDAAASSDESDMTRRQILEGLGVEILSDDDYQAVQARWKETQDWINENVPTQVARGLLRFGNSVLSIRGNDISDLDQALPLDGVVMGLEGLRSAVRWLSMNPNRIRPQDLLAAPGLAFMVAPLMGAMRRGAVAAAGRDVMQEGGEAVLRGVSDADPIVTMPNVRNVTPDNDVAGRGIPQAAVVDDATAAIVRDMTPPAAANDMTQPRPALTTDVPELEPHVAAVNRRYLAEEGASVTVANAYKTYRQEAIRAGIEPLNQAYFNRMMADAGFERVKIGGRDRYVGIVLSDQSKGQVAGTALTSAAERATAQNVRTLDDLVKEFNIKRVAPNQSPASALKSADDRKKDKSD